MEGGHALLESCKDTRQGRLAPKDCNKELMSHPAECRVNWGMQRFV